VYAAPGSTATIGTATISTATAMKLGGTRRAAPRVVPVPRTSSTIVLASPQ
jgi:hypothetical protein